MKNSNNTTKETKTTTIKNAKAFATKIKKEDAQKKVEAVETIKKKVATKKPIVKAITKTITKSDKETKSDKATIQRMYINSKPTDTPTEQKKFRGKMRRQLKKNVNLILSICLTKKKEGLKDAKDSFLSFYKEQYTINDFNVESIYNGNNIEWKADLKECLIIVKRK